ncbi:CYFA0S18e00562g1_1 [Cyberlindnera fabianii]|uniref:Succinate dehydrogenase [ubiquinone] cytochrome b small subunit n=1 Tax=Cyberlindnera fabianii TaxID=36022 RepID=A0A061B5Z2_CYBFA|nr:Succinate dehydrogenase [ubiquinone] cytochrome b small subunit, mitochondrial [Cyberlindnera fabianii]CDR45381.1 CYFA0S18e00562g1_1 [Cyberlindnera fabianii]
MFALTKVGLSVARGSVQQTAFKATATTALHTSAVRKFDIPFLKQIPQPPGYIVGTVNDAYIGPKASRSHGSLHWTAERLISIGLVPLATVPFFTGSVAPVLDATFAGLILAHSFIGFQSCIIDYIPKRVYGKQHDYAMWLLAFGTAVAAYGIYEIESKDVGLTGVLKKLWNKPEEKKN